MNDRELLRRVDRKLGLADEYLRRRSELVEEQRMAVQQSRAELREFLGSDEHALCDLVRDVREASQAAHRYQLDGRAEIKQAREERRAFSETVDRFRAGTARRRTE